MPKFLLFHVGTFANFIEIEIFNSDILKFSTKNCPSYFLEEILVTFSALLKKKGGGGNDLTYFIPMSHESLKLSCMSRSRPRTKLFLAGYFPTKVMVYEEVIAVLNDQLVTSFF